MRNIIILSMIAISFLVLCHSRVFAQQSLLSYENPDYDIKMQYPANWTKNEIDLPPQSPVYFSTPTQYSYQTPNATMNVFVIQVPANYTFDQAIQNAKSYDLQSVQKGMMRVVNSSYTTLSGLRAWQDVYYDYTNNKNMKKLMVLTMKDGEQFQLLFTAQPGEFNRYLPMAEKMIQSFQITKMRP